jgi:sugar lactone lactonase YvrE
MRWLWRDYPDAVKPTKTVNILEPGTGWELVSEGHKFTEGPAVNTRGELFFTDIPNNRIHKVGSDGKVTVFAENTGGANGLMFGPDGRLFACASGRKAIVAYDPSGKEATVAEDITSNDLVVNHKGEIYVTDPSNKKVWFINKRGEKKTVDDRINRPNGVTLSPDQSLLLVADTSGQFVYSFQIQEDGTLTHRQRYFHLHLVDGSTQSGADGMKVDARGNLYVTTEMGLQVCDQAGRVNSIIPKPQRAWLSNVCFAGPALDEMVVTCGDKVYKRKVKAKGVLAFQAPFKPDAPRL